MIRVAQVIWSGNFGGIERLAFDLCAAQEKNPEIEVDLIIGKREGQYLEKLSGMHITHHFANLKSGFDFSYRKYSELIKAFRKFDIIHLHFFNLLIAYAAIRSGKKIVYTEHGNFGFGRKKKFTDRLNYFFLKKFLKKYVSFISFNSEFTAKIAKQRYGLENNKSAVVYNGISFSETPATEILNHELSERLEGKFVVGTSSRFAGFKRIDRLVRAFAEFQKDKNTVLLLVGEGIEGRELERLTERLEIGERTIFTGYRKDVRQMQQLMDVCVFPSQNEPFGLVAIESLSLGKPVIVFRDGGGIAEIISKVSEADLIEDEKALVKRLNFYFNNRAEILKDREKRIQFSKSFDIRFMEEKFFKIYKEII